MKAAFDIADIAPCNGNRLVVQMQRQSALIAHIDIGTGMTWNTGHGSTYILNPITGASRLKQRRERQQNHKGSTHER